MEKLRFYSIKRSFKNYSKISLKEFVDMMMEYWKDEKTNLKPEKSDNK